MKNFRKLFIYSFALIILVSIVEFFSITSISFPKSPLGQDSTPPGPAHYTQTPPTQTSKSSVTLKGLSQANSTLTVLSNNIEIGRVLVSEASTFSVDVPLSVGDNPISLRVIDQSGNVSVASGIITIKREI